MISTGVLVFITTFGIIFVKAGYGAILGYVFQKPGKEKSLPTDDAQHELRSFLKSEILALRSENHELRTSYATHRVEFYRLINLIISHNKVCNHPITNLDDFLRDWSY